MGNDRQPAAAALRAHLQERYPIDVAGLAELEAGGGVYRVDRRDGPRWVARVFPPERPLHAVEGDAEILRYLARRGFRWAERRAHPHATSELDGCGVLVTEYVDGVNSRGDRSVEMSHAQGELIGRLHALPPEPGAVSRPAGAWHALVPAGGTRRDDVAALLPLLAGARERAPARRRGLYDALRDELEAVDHCADLPQGLLHPDPAAANIMGTDGGPVLIDWTGAGRGPRVLPLGMALARGAFGPDHVDAVVAGYARHVRPGGDEVARLAGPVRLHALIMACWYAVFAPGGLPAGTKWLADERQKSEAIAARAADAFASASRDAVVTS